MVQTERIREKAETEKEKKAGVVALFHHRWNVRVLAAFHGAGGGTRVAVLTRELDVHRDALRASLEALQQAEWIERNPGYGHPLRPEYVLTRTGRRLAPACARFDRVASRIEARPIAYKKWSAPVLASVRSGAARFNAIQLSLAGVTPRALASSLKGLCEWDLIVREVADDHPPRVHYGLSPSGARLAAATDGIVRHV